jgi:hypothetical protein
MGKYSDLGGIQVAALGLYLVDLALALVRRIMAGLRLLAMELLLSLRIDF